MTQNSNIIKALKTIKKEIGMKTCLFAVFAIACLVVIAPCALAQTAAKLDVVLTSQTPYPAEPGGNVNVEIEIQNNGYADATNVNIEIVPSEPLSLVQGQESRKTFNRISARNSVKTDFDLKVDSSAVSDEYELGFRLYTGTDLTNFVTEKVTVNIQGMPKLVLGEIITDPESIEPGGIVKMTIPVKNTGTGDARQLQLTIVSNYSEIVPVLSKGSVYIGTLEAAQTKNAEIEVGIDRDADYKIYLGTLYAVYKDEGNTQHTDSFSVGIPVTGNIIISMIKSDIDFADREIDVEIANKGTADASSLEAKLYINDKLVDIDYISQLKATKKTTLSFPLAKDGSLISGNGRLVISYVGPDLKKYEVAKDIVVNAASQAGSPLGTAAFVIIVAVVGFFVYTRYFRKRGKRPRH